MYKILICLIIISFELFAQMDSSKTEQNVMDSTVSIQDTTNLSDTTIIKQKKILIPINSLSLFDFPSSDYFFINKENFYFSDYRYTSDILTNYLPAYKRSLGFVGQPEEVSIYGFGFNNINYFENGILLNHRIKNSYNLNLFQNEDIDSIEIIPLPRGFLYGVLNNPVSINFITKDFIPEESYSRIKYIEGPYGEGFFDGQFNSLLAKKLLFAFDITNRKYDESYTNSDFGIWQVKTKLKYLFSNNFNLFFQYDYNRVKTGLNGGVNVDTILARGLDLNSYLYNISAAVNLPNTYEKNHQHNFTLKFLTKFSDNDDSINTNQLEATFYYRYNLDEFRQNEFAFNDSSLHQIPPIKNNKTYKTFGNLLRFNFRKNLFHFQIIENFETSDHIEDIFNQNILTYSSTTTNSSIALIGIASLNFFNGKLIPSVFTKFISDELNDNSLNIGGDINFKLNDDFNFYGGISKSNRNIDRSYYIIPSTRKDTIAIPIPSLSNKNIEQKLVNAELGINFKSKFFSTNLKGFYSEIDNKYSQGIIPHDNDGLISFRLNDKIKNYGLGISMILSLWKINLENQTNIFKSSLNSNYEKFYPEFTTRTSLFFNSILFDSSLYLKTGFTFKYQSSQKYFQYDFYNSRIYFYVNEKDLNSNNQLDFFLAGRIQGRAILYFIWENLFDKKYYITPYYPMPARGIRFGVSWELYN